MVWDESSCHGTQTSDKEAEFNTQTEEHWMGDAPRAEYTKDHCFLKMLKSIQSTEG